jgi:hypothetical protein
MNGTRITTTTTTTITITTSVIVGTTSCTHSSHPLIAHTQFYR